MVEIKIASWIKRNRLEFFLITAVLIIAALLRFYRLPEYMYFLGDEGRDALIIKKLLVEGDLPFIGPPTSIGNIYLGPLYYYMMAVPMAIFWLNPVAAAYQVALIGVATVGLIYYLGRQWFSKYAALISAFLYAISPVNIIYSRSSWNPNPTPFFALLAFVGIYQARKSGNFLWFILTGASLAFAVQMHYLALILLPIVGVLWIYEAKLLRQLADELFYFHTKKIKQSFFSSKIKMKNFFKGTILGVIIFLILMSPLLIFDLKHDFMNYKAISAFFTSRETTVNINPLNTLGRIYPIYQDKLISRYIGGNDSIITFVVSIVIFLPLLIGTFIRFPKTVLYWPLLSLGVWLIVGVLGLALYKQSIYDHYLGFLNPAPFLLFGSLVYIFQLIRESSFKTVTYLLIAILVGVLVIINFKNTPFQYPPNKQLEKTQRVANFIILQSGNKPFNFALLSKNNYDAAYQFYLDIYGHKPQKVPFNITEQLFVVCEDPVCDPVGHPKYEIAAFGWAKIEKLEDFSGVKVYKLVHNITGRPI